MDRMLGLGLDDAGADREANECACSRLVYQYGVGQVITGFDEGLANACVGGTHLCPGRVHRGGD